MFNEIYDRAANLLLIIQDYRGKNTLQPYQWGYCSLNKAIVHPYLHYS